MRCMCGSTGKQSNAMSIHLPIKRLRRSGERERKKTIQFDDLVEAKKQKRHEKGVAELWARCLNAQNVSNIPE